MSLTTSSCAGPTIWLLVPASSGSKGVPRIGRLCRSLAVVHARPALLDLDEQQRLDLDTPSGWTMSERFVSQRPVAGASAR